VSDLIEGLGQAYEQSVLTGYIPSPPAYVGLNITELRFSVDEQPFVEYFAQTKPALIHVHYWGGSDKLWYVKALKAAEQLGIPVVENINTPVAPYFSSAVKRYIYVSDYVRRVFGKDNPSHLTIYPGSDFEHFYSGENDSHAENCIGMVYRLERDKLNEASILPFILAVQKRPNTRVLIVGGGSLLEEYKRAVTEAGVMHYFEFTDYVSYVKLPEYYRQMTLFVAPVWKESFGQVSPFAMSMGIPVVGYNVGALEEIIGDSSLLALSNDSDALAKIIIDLLDDKQRREQIGQRNCERAHRLFSVGSMIDSYAELYKELVENK
jgi:glycosyltransferase involved in cell wall biosynthesis